MKSATVRYTIAKKLIEMTFAEHGETLSCMINGVECIGMPDAEDACVAVIKDAGFDLQADISQAFDEKETA